MLARISILAAVALAGLSLALVAGGSTTALDDKTTFCTQFVPNEKASWNSGAVLNKWWRANPGEVSRWTAFADGICADQSPASPAVSTLHGKTLVAAGEMALPETPPPPPTTTTTTTTTEPPPTTTTTEPPPGSVTLQQIDGGTSYYGQFSNPLPDSNTYFPIGVWGSYAHEQVNRDKDAAVGINVYVWVADNAYMAEIRADGRFKVIQDEGNRTGVGSETAGWLLADEIDMCCGPPDFAGGNGYNMLDSILASLPADGRFRYANYGKGVLIWESDTDAARFINGRNGPNSYQQVVSADLYWFTDPHDGPGNRFGSKYGDNVSRLRMLDRMDGAVQPVWNFVEVGWPFTESASAGGRAILPDEIRSAVWHSIIAGARGIIYFQHNFGGPCITHFVLRGECYPANRDMAAAVDAQVKTLAPVLNAPFVTSGHSSSDTMDGTVRYMVKWDGSNFYVFAGADRSGGSASFAIPCVGNATATVVGESRTLTVAAGAFGDSFADKNAVHIYRIDGGSRCGL